MNVRLARPRRVDGNASDVYQAVGMTVSLGAVRSGMAGLGFGGVRAIRVAPATGKASGERQEDGENTEVV